MKLFKRQPKDPEIERVYKDTYKKTFREERLKNAEARAKRAAKAKANAKPFYQKLMGMSESVSRSLSVPNAGSALEEMAFGSPKKRKRRKK
jgi:hypothetical protein